MIASLWLLASPVHADGSTSDTSDIHVGRTIAASPEEIAKRVDSTADFAHLLAGCTRDWVHGADDAGPARVTYRILSFRRRLTARVYIRQPNRVIELDHEGNKGFVTRVTLTSDAPGTADVELSTWLNPPGWPFRKYYRDAVRPGWIACYEEALTRLEAP